MLDAARGPASYQPAKPVKVALLTPYWGGNLGDAAIQTTVIANVRKRFPQAEIVLVTLSPASTTKLHDVPSFPLAVLPVGHYSSGRSRTRRVQGTTASHAGVGEGFQARPGVASESLSRSGAGRASPFATTLGRVRAAVKASRLLTSCLRPMHRVVFVVPMLAMDEIGHILEAYKLMKAIDILIVSGGGQLDDYYGGPWGHPYALLKWGLLARAAGKRYVFLSVGTCALESRLSRFFLRHALALASYRSYRDRASKKLLPGMPFTSQDAVCPDLAFGYVHPRSVASGASRNTGETVGVSPIAYLSAYGWPKTDLAAYGHYLSALIGLIAQLLRRGYRIKLFSTDVPDRNVVADIVARLESDATLISAGRVSHPRTDTLDELIHELGTVDYVVASRLHGILLSNLCRIPVLAISYDRKVDTYMEDMRLSRYCLDFHQVTAESLAGAFEALTRDDDAIRRQLDETAVRFADELKHQYDLVLDGNR